MISTVIFILSFILNFNFWLFILDDFQLSKNKYIRITQKLSPLFIIVWIYLITLETTSILNNVISMVGDNNNNPNITVGDNIEISKEAGVEISKGIVSLGRNIGLAGSISGVAAAVTKSVTHTSLPPMQKAGITVGGAIIGGAIHLGASAINNLKNQSNLENTSTTETVNSGGDVLSNTVSKLVASNKTSDLSNLI